MDYSSLFASGFRAIASRHRRSSSSADPLSPTSPTYQSIPWSQRRDRSLSLIISPHQRKASSHRASENHAEDGAKSIGDLASSAWDSPTLPGYPPSSFRPYEYVADTLRYIRITADDGLSVATPRAAASPHPRNTPLRLPHQLHLPATPPSRPSTAPPANNDAVERSLWENHSSPSPLPTASSTRIPSLLRRCHPHLPLRFIATDIPWQHPLRQEPAQDGIPLHLPPGERRGLTYRCLLSPRCPRKDVRLVILTTRALKTRARRTGGRLSMSSWRTKTPLRSELDYPAPTRSRQPYGGDTSLFSLD